MFTEAISYRDGHTDLEAFMAYPSKEKRPLVILCHAWRGRDDFICDKARELTQWGYVGFALDTYGKGVLGKSKDENAALKRPFIENREMLQKRIVKGFEMACNSPYVDVSRVAVLGYGFGGLCALDLARSGVDLKGAISIYGHFDPPRHSLIKLIKAKILILHGDEDKIVTPKELELFQSEMKIAKVDWQAHVYGGTMHAFATPGVNDPASGLLYNPRAASRAWVAIQNFLNEIFTL